MDKVLTATEFVGNFSKPVADNRFKFKLSDEFISKYEAIKPKWGPLGEFVYLRTYSRWIYDDDGNRRKERWFETVRRIVEGTFNIQKKWCIDHKVTWNNHKAQKSAKIMFEKIFNFKFLPAGRGIWAMGTEVIDIKGGAALQSCAFTTTEKIKEGDVSCFEFLMDMSMLGVGVGFDTEGRETIEIKQPVYTDEIIIVDDTREGWVAVLTIIMNGFINGGEIPVFDYNLIRPLGSRIKTFGGEASGPGPLIQMVIKIQERLNACIGNMISTTNIVDIMNLIGKCVVSGNVRRSAEISLGYEDDEEFVNLKNFELYPEECSWETGWRWASNNTVKCEVGQDYRHLGERIAANGEPGLLWLQNIRDFGRMLDEPDFADYQAVGTNPSKAA